MASKLELKLLEKGLNRIIFAGLIGVSPQAVGYWARKKNLPKRIDAINKACKVLDMTPIEFMGLFS